MSPWEGVAVVLAIAYLLLAAREHPACWGCALISTVIYTALFWNVSLLMESLLNVYYMVMAVYGWWLWQRGGVAREGLVITRWRPRRHLVVIAAVLAAAAVTGALLSRHTAAAWPYVDSFTTWGAIVTTWMVARKVLENWIYWFVIDGISIPLYLDRGLYLTAGLFAVYLVIVVFGFVQWRREYAAGRGAAVPA
ncbi:MAG: nicotinamide riboside transporter PnuC [Gammaproteobacteria bacterium]